MNKLFLISVIWIMVIAGCIFRDFVKSTKTAEPIKLRSLNTANEASMVKQVENLKAHLISVRRTYKDYTPDDLPYSVASQIQRYKDEIEAITKEINSRKACSRNPDTLDLETKNKFYLLQRVAINKGIKFSLSCAKRSDEEQARLYAQGRTTPGEIVTWVKHSKHQDGKAFDVTAPIEDLKRLGKIGKRIGLIYGGDWTQKDYGHFEIK